MKHLDPRQIEKPKKSPPEQQKKNRTGLFWGLSMIVIVLGLGAAGTAFFSRGAIDQVSDQEKQDRQIAFTKVRELAVTPVDSSQIDSALDEMRLTPPERAQMRGMIQDKAPASQTSTTGAGPSAVTMTFTPTSQDKPLRLVSISLWDSDAEDGDVVAVISGGYRREILLTKAVQTVTIPVDQASLLKIVGVRDGGGGITVGIRGPSQEILVPILAEGEVLSLPIAR